MSEEHNEQNNKNTLVYNTLALNKPTKKFSGHKSGELTGYNVLMFECLIILYI